MKGSKNRRWLDIISDRRLANSFASQSLLMDGHELSKADKIRVYDAYVGELCLMSDVAKDLDNRLDLSPATGYSRDFSTANLTHILIAWSKTDVIEFVTQTKAMLLALRHLSSKKGERNYPSFNAWLTAFEVQRKSVCVAPFMRLLRFVWVTLDYRVFESLNTLLQYTSRLTLTDVDWVAEEEVEKYISDEIDYKTWTYPLEILEEMRSVIRWWLRDFTLDGARGQHGYGATAGVKRSAGTTAKYKDFLPTRETAILCSWMDWWPEDYFWPGLSAAHSLLLFADDADKDFPWYHENVEQHMRYNLVPKAFNKKRGVSMEPTSHMFMQKMLFGLLDDYFECHPECHIHLHDQETSRHLCVEGSRTLKYSTIDLSSASDTVTKTLVEYVFQDNILGDALRLCRTSYADVTWPDGRVTTVELEKFAPMGSAVCFPIECLVFSSIVAVAQQRLGLYDDYRVYGDDIVCSTRLFDEVVGILTRLNFKVNLDKSYGHESDFTEACGMEAYMGHNVSPLRIARKWNACAFYESPSRKGPDNSTALSGAYDAVNDAYARGYMLLRSYRLRQTLEKYPGAMFSHRADVGILSTREDSTVQLYDSSRIRYDRRRQRLLVKGQFTVSTIAAGSDLMRWSKLAEEYAYTERSSLLLPEDAIPVKCGAAHSYTKWKWVPLVDIE